MRVPKQEDRTHRPMDDAVHGMVGSDRADSLLGVLRLHFQEPTYVVERMWATSWQAVEENLPGLQEH